MQGSPNTGVTLIMICPKFELGFMFTHSLMCCYGSTIIVVRHAVSPIFFFTFQEARQAATQWYGTSTYRVAHVTDSHSSTMSVLPTSSVWWAALLLVVSCLRGGCACCMANVTTPTGLLRRPEAFLKGRTGLSTVRETVAAARECKRRGVRRQECGGRGGREARGFDCLQGGDRRNIGVRESTSCLEQGAEAHQRGLLLDISIAQRSPCAAALVGVAETTTSSPEGREYEEEAPTSGSNGEGTTSLDLQERARSRENVGSGEGEESYEAQRDRQVAKVHKRFQLLLQQKSDM